MIAYERKNKKAKRRFYLSLGCLALLLAGIVTYQTLMPKQSVPVFSDFPVLKLPDKETAPAEEEPAAEVKEKIILPYKNGKKVVDYFDGESSDIVSIIEFEGVFRPSQGVDISNNGEVFEVVSAADGTVLDVTADPLLGNSIRIQSDDVIITYQSLDKITLKKGDHVLQGDVIGSAGSNIYQASLKNHLHLVVEKDQVRVDPNTIFKFE